MVKKCERKEERSRIEKWSRKCRCLNPKYLERFSYSYETKYMFYAQYMLMCYINYKIYNFRNYRIQYRNSLLIVDNNYIRYQVKCTSRSFSFIILFIIINILKFKSIYIQNMTLFGQFQILIEYMELDENL